MRVLWIYGTSCVGKSATAWELFNSAEIGERRIGYVDIDELAMCYPPPSDDPDRMRLKAKALRALIASAGRIPLDLLIVSGVLDSKTLLDHRDLFSQYIFVRLTLAADELETRLRDRWGSPDVLKWCFELASSLEHARLPHPVIDTTGKTVPQVARAVMAASALWPLHPAAGTVDQAPTTSEDVPGTEVLVLTGATPVGKSTVGFEAARAQWQEGSKAAYLDLGQLELVRPPLRAQARDRHRSGSLAAVARVFAEAGARRLVISGRFASPISLESALQDLSSNCAITPCRLEADGVDLRSRAESRSKGDDLILAGDDLVGMGVADRERLVQEALDEAAPWAGWSDGPVVNSSRQTPAETLNTVLRATGWTPDDSDESSNQRWGG